MKLTLRLDDGIIERAKVYARIHKISLSKMIELSVSSLTIANTNYVLLKQMDAHKAKSILRKLRLILKILPVDNKIVGLALNDDTFNDFEEGLKYFTAIENGKEVIITRNLKDDKNSKLPAMTARQFIESNK